jgi:hypothetical protein
MGSVGPVVCGRLGGGSGWRVSTHRRATVREIVTGLTAESLDDDTKPVETPGWPESRSYPPP